MIIIPVNTDAPIYHWPWMTLVLIASNAVAFFVTGFGEDTSGWLLRYGQGLNPVEWIAYNFLHFGWLHLIGNMVFLWGFGIVVEGKLGWWRFLLVFLSIGVLGGVLIQAVMVGHDPLLKSGSGGASLIVYGLLAVCVVWAPKNEMDVLILLGYRAVSIEISILTFGVWYVALQILSAWWNHFSMGASMGHLVGAFWGFGIGTALLKLQWVDCENWDLFAIWKGTYGKPADSLDWKDKIVVTHSPGLCGAEQSTTSAPLKKKKAIFRPTIYQTASPKRRQPTDLTPAPPSVADDEETSARIVNRSKSESVLPIATLKVLDLIRQLIRAGKPQAALGEYRKRRRIVDHWQLDERDLQSLAESLFKLKLWDEAIPLLEEFVERFSVRADDARIKLAGICCDVQNRPRAALKLLDQIDFENLPAAARDHVAEIRHSAERLLEDDTFELDGKSW